MNRYWVIFFFFFLFSLVGWAQVTLHPDDNVPRIVSGKPSGTTFLFTPGTYRLYEPIKPKDNDKFIGETSCVPPTTSCPAVITGSVVIGPLAKFDGTNYEVTKQPQHGPRGVPQNCDPGWSGCFYPEDLFFDGKPLKHLDSPTLPTIGSGEWWFDYDNHIIYFHDNPSGHTVETSVVTNGFGGPASHITIQYLTIEEFATMYPFGGIGGPQGANSLTQATHWTVENCEVRLIHGMAIRVEYAMQILNNYIHHNGQAGIGGAVGFTSAPSTQSTSSDILIQGNAIDYNNYAHFNPGFGSGGFKVGATSGIVLRGNTIQNNEGSGIHFDVNSMNELVDGNLITDNSDSDGIVQEIGYGKSTFRNNVVLHNGAQLNSNNWSFQIATRASADVDAYCNVLEVPAGGPGVGAFGIAASKRDRESYYPPFAYLKATGNSFHHNTVIWDSGANGFAGFYQADPRNQPEFFANNIPPDYNSYHLPSTSAPLFIYDNDGSGSNKRKPFAAYRAARVDVHSTIDTNINSGFPTVTITSPADQSSVANSVTVKANASDKSGIRKVEFYVDWKLQTTVTNAPYDFNWTNGATGSHIVAAMAYSNSGIPACYAITLNEQ
jgi:hypothetical protein